MALPPTVIQDFFRGSPEATYDCLFEAGLLSNESKKSKQELIARLKQVQDAYYADRSGMVGPNLDDEWSDALSPYLNDMGHKLARMDALSMSWLDKMKLKRELKKCAKQARKERKKRQ